MESPGSSQTEHRWDDLHSANASRRGNARSHLSTLLIWTVRSA
jgi:hypothetical protein